MQQSDCHSFLILAIFMLGAVEESQASAAKEMFDYISVLSNGLNKMRDEMGVKLCALLTRMQNALEFGMGIIAHN